MGMDGVMYGYIVRNLRKPKKDFCLSIGLVGSFVWILKEKNDEYTNPWRLTEVVGTSIGNVGDSLFEARRS
jgi:lipoprotein signal peptidase